MPRPSVSVLLIVKNALPLLIGALDSLKQQTFKDFDVVVADGGSTDGTIGVLHQAADELPLRIVSESDQSLADGTARAIPHATGDIIGCLCADERYYPHTIEQVVKWFEAESAAIMCGGKLDFLNERGQVVDSHLTAPFNPQAHLACEVVPSILPSFFNRRLIGDDFRVDNSVPTCPDYEFWARLGFRFPASAFKRSDVSVAQAYRTRASMSFRAESFTQTCRDKLTHLNNLLAKGYVRRDVEAVRRRSSAGIHMWAAEQLSFIERDHPDTLAHCAAAARYDKSYGRIARFIAASGKARYDAASGTVTRWAANRLGPRREAVAEFRSSSPLPHWPGAAILQDTPLTLQTSQSPWGFSLSLSAKKQNYFNVGAVSKAYRPIDNYTAVRLRAWLRISRSFFYKPRNEGQYWARLDLEVADGCVSVATVTPSHDLIGETIVRRSDGRIITLIPAVLDGEGAATIMVRSGGHPSSIARIYQASLVRDQDGAYTTVAPIELGQ